MLPLTVKFKGFAEVDERPETVTVLDPPAEIEPGLKEHVGPPAQDSEMLPRSVLRPVAEIVKVAVVEPMRTTLDRALEESAKLGLPVPASCNVGVFTAFEEIRTLPLILPVVVGAKLTEMVQVWPTFNDAGTVGRLAPQLLDCPKLPVAPMLVMVTV